MKPVQTVVTKIDHLVITREGPFCGHAWHRQLSFGWVTFEVPLKDYYNVKENRSLNKTML